MTNQEIYELMEASDLPLEVKTYFQLQRRALHEAMCDAVLHPARVRERLTRFKRGDVRARTFLEAAKLLEKAHGEEAFIPQTSFAPGLFCIIGLDDDEMRFYESSKLVKTRYTDTLPASMMDVARWIEENDVACYMFGEIGIAPRAIIVRENINTQAKLMLFKMRWFGD